MLGVPIRTSLKIPNNERRASEDLLPHFLAALGRSGKNLDSSADEMKVPRATINKWASGSHLNIGYHDTVKEWISKQPTSIDHLRVKKANRTYHRAVFAASRSN